MYKFLFLKKLKHLTRHTQKFSVLLPDLTDFNFSTLPLVSFYHSKKVLFLVWMVNYFF